MTFALKRASPILSGLSSAIRECPMTGSTATTLESLERALLRYNCGLWAAFSWIASLGLHAWYGGSAVANRLLGGGSLTQRRRGLRLRTVPQPFLCWTT